MNTKNKLPDDFLLPPFCRKCANGINATCKVYGEFFCEDAWNEKGCSKFTPKEKQATEKK